MDKIQTLSAVLKNQAKPVEVFQIHPPNMDFLKTYEAQDQIVLA